MIFGVVDDDDDRNNDGDDGVDHGVHATFRSDFCLPLFHDNDDDDNEVGLLLNFLLFKFDQLDDDDNGRGRGC